MDTKRRGPRSVRCDRGVEMSFLADIGQVARPPEYIGRHRILGVVDELGVVGPYVVRCYGRAFGRFIAETISDEEGNYVFENLAYLPQGYFMVAHDWPSPGDPVNGAISDLITPEPMA